MDLDEDDPGSAYTAKVLEDDDDEYALPMVEYFDEKGNNVTPLPLHTLDEADQEQLERDPRRRRYPPRQNPVMRTFLHVTTALYSMAGLGSLEKSKKYKAIKREMTEDHGDEGDDDAARKKKAAAAAAARKKKLEMSKASASASKESEGDDVAMSAAARRRRKECMPDSMLAKTAKEIDILLVETDTMWMLDLPGTCIEIDPDKKEEEEGEEEKEEADEKKKEQQKKREEEEKNVSRYELVESWTQTLDYSKKKKGAQCDDIVTNESTTQVSMKNFLDEQKKQQQLMQQELMSPGAKSPRSPGPGMTDPFA